MGIGSRNMPTKVCQQVPLGAHRIMMVLLAMSLVITASAKSCPVPGNMLTSDPEASAACDTIANAQGAVPCLPALQTCVKSASDDASKCMCLRNAKQCYHQ